MTIKIKEHGVPGEKKGTGSRGEQKQGKIARVEKQGGKQGCSSG